MGQSFYEVALDHIFLGLSKEVCNRALLQTSLVDGRGNQKKLGKNVKALYGP
jgi:hypothetical protein